jgi:hypothetical protein
VEQLLKNRWKGFSCVYVCLCVPTLLPQIRQTHRHTQREKKGTCVAKVNHSAISFLRKKKGKRHV